MVRLDPSAGIRFGMEAKRADGVGPEGITLDMEFADQGGDGPTPYEVLLHAALVGDDSRFPRQVGIEEAWCVVQPLLDAVDRIVTAPGSSSCPPRGSNPEPMD